jgi:hypothetical protein
MQAQSEGKLTFRSLPLKPWVWEATNAKSVSGATFSCRMITRRIARRLASLGIFSCCDSNARRQQAHTRR